MYSVYFSVTFSHELTKYFSQVWKSQSMIWMSLRTHDENVCYFGFIIWLIHSNVTWATGYSVTRLCALQVIMFVFILLDNEGKTFPLKFWHLSLLPLLLCMLFSYLNIFCFAFGQKSRCSGGIESRKRIAKRNLDKTNKRWTSVCPRGVRETTHWTWCQTSDSYRMRSTFEFTTTCHYFLYLCMPHYLFRQILVSVNFSSAHTAFIVVVVPESRNRNNILAFALNNYMREHSNIN